MKVSSNSKTIMKEFSKTFNISSKLIKADQGGIHSNMTSNSNSLASSLQTINLPKQTDIDISNKFKYYIGPGNNDRCIKKLMKKREWWESAGEYKRPIINKNNKSDKKKKDFHNLKIMQDADFTWVQTSKESNYDNLKGSNKFRIFNHFPIHTTISSKYNLMKNFSETCNELGLNVFSFLPLTFALDRDSLEFKQEYNQFLKYFNKFTHEEELQKEKPQINKKTNKNPVISQKMSKNFVLQKISKQKIKNAENNIKSKYLKNKSIINYNLSKIPDTFNAGKNIWLIKPQGYNRGFGVELFDNLKELKVLMNNMLSGYTEKLQIDKEEIKRSNKSIKSRKFVIQKYIERPLLYKNKKFDMR